MTFQVVWSPQARSDLRAILTYIKAESPAGARKINGLIMESVANLRDYPLLYRQGRVEGTREALFHPNYLYVYAVEAGKARILRVLHARQQYP